MCHCTALCQRKAVTSTYSWFPKNRTECVPSHTTPWQTWNLSTQMKPHLNSSVQKTKHNCDNTKGSFWDFVIWCRSRTRILWIELQWNNIWNEIFSIRKSPPDSIVLQVQWFYVPWAQIASAGTHSIKLDATLPFENYILLVTSEATRTCRLYKLFRAGDRPGFMRMGKCPYLGMFYREAISAALFTWGQATELWAAWREFSVSWDYARKWRWWSIFIV